MWSPFAVRKPKRPTAAPAPPEARRGPAGRKGRRAATTMEYAAVISFILLVCIALIQSFGLSVRNIFTHDAQATSKAQPPGK
jgi:Flp pilus assembly pilin Flp